MKKTLNCFGLFLLMGVLAVSCNKVEFISSDSNENKSEQPAEPQEDPAVSIPGVELNASGQMLSFSAAIDPVTVKATVAENGNVSWEDGDLVKVSVGEQTSVYKYDGEKFVPDENQDPVSLSADAYFYYPADAYSSVGSTATLSVGGAVSRGAFGDKNPMGAVLAQNSAEAIFFKNLCSVLRVTVSGDRTMTSLVLANTTANISGSASVSWSGTGSAAAPTVSIGSAATSQTITESVNLSNDVADFYFIVPAASLTGMTITANLSGEGIPNFKICREGSLAMARSTITSVSLYAGLFHGGAGTQANPYKIADIRDFVNIQRYCESGYDGTVDASHFLAACYQQTEDIDFDTDGTPWTLTPIATSANKFTGSYDGDGHVLSNFSITVSADGAGLWAYAEDADFANLSLSGATVNGGSTYNNIGALVGDVSGSTSIEGVSVAGSTITGNASVGGLAGVFSGDLIKSCSNAGTINGQYYVGGIVGKLDANAGDDGKITESYNTGAILASKDTGTNNKEAYAAAGGIAGLLNGAATIEKCYNHGNVVSTYAMAGGIAGMMLGGTVDCCYSGKGDTKAQIKARYYSGGIVGVMKNAASAVVNSASSATVGAPDGYGMAGGIAGDVMGGSKLANCVALAAKVWSSNSANARAGAIVGTIEGNESTVHNCYSQINNTSTVGYSSDGNTVVGNSGNIKRGGVYANFYTGIVKDCYYTAGGPGAGNESTANPRTKSGNFKQITNNAKNGTADDSFSNFANGQTGGTMRLKAALTKGATGVSYNGVSLCEWVAKKDGTEQAYPSTLQALGINYRDN